MYSPLGAARPFLLALLAGCVHFRSLASVVALTWPRTWLVAAFTLASSIKAQQQKLDVYTYSYILLVYNHQYSPLKFMENKG